MRRPLLFAAALWSLSLFAGVPAEPGVGARPVIEVGQDVPDMCWSGIGEQRICLSGFADTVRVLVYSTGWCPACNQEMSELAPRAKEFEGQPVTFVSLSAQGDQHGSEPTEDFLKSWKERHNIPFLVAASPKDAGKSFFAPPLYIPNVAIVGKDGKLAYKAVGPEVDAVFAEIKKALARP